MFNISSSVIILHLGKPAAIKSHFVSPALPLFDCVASTTQRSRKKMKRASTRGALWTFLQMLSQRLSRAASPLLLFFLALVSLLRSAFLCIKTPNLSQLVGEEFVVIVPSSVSVVAVPGELRAPPPPRPALFREQRIFHRYCAGSILAISLTLGQDWIISNYLELGLKCPFLHRERADFPIYLFFIFFILGK